MELAHQGTVFLDEIGDISPELQTKLLRFLEERQFERVGGTRSIFVDIRIIAATNHDLKAQVRDGIFREDLYHRLHVFPITLQTLRERKEDIPALAQYFLQKYCREAGKNSQGITKEAEDKLLAHNWPGNVRELANVTFQCSAQETQVRQALPIDARGRRQSLHERPFRSRAPERD